MVFMDYLLNSCLLAVIYILFFRKRWKENPAHNLELNFIMYLYVGLVLMVTLMPFATPFGEIRDSISHTINLIPFRDLSLGYRGAEREILLNVVMLIPFGFLYPAIKRRGLLITVLMTFLFSLTIETAQLVSNWWGGRIPRLFDVTDLITNTAGGFLGYLLFLIFGTLFLKVAKVGSGNGGDSIGK